MITPVRNCGRVHTNTLHMAFEPGKEGSLPWQVTVLDPTIPIDMSQLGVASQGIFLKERVFGYDMKTGKPEYIVDPITNNVVYDIYDVIGDGYPNAWDFVAEYAVAGLHRLVPKNTQISLLSPSSEYWGIHMKGHLMNAKDLYPHRLNGIYEKCYSDDENMMEVHVHPTEDWLEYNANTCASLLYNCITGKRGEREKGSRTVRREMALTSYEAYAPPDGFDPEWYPALFIRIPIGLLGYWSLFRDRNDPEALEKVEKQYQSLHESLQRQVIVDLEDISEEDRIQVS